MSKKSFKNWHKSNKDTYIVGAIYSYQVQEYAEDAYGRELTDKEMEEILYLLMDDRVWDWDAAFITAIDIVMGELVIKDGRVSPLELDEG